MVQDIPNPNILEDFSDADRIRKITNLKALASRPGTEAEGKTATFLAKRLENKISGKSEPAEDPYKQMRFVAKLHGFKPHVSEKDTFIHPSGWKAEFFGDNKYFLSNPNGTKVGASEGSLKLHADIKMFKGYGAPLGAKKTCNEDAPANCVGGGQIAGVGVGPQGEPGVSKKAKLIKKILRRKLPTKVV